MGQPEFHICKNRKLTKFKEDVKTDYSDNLELVKAFFERHNTIPTEEFAQEMLWSNVDWDTIHNCPAIQVADHDDERIRLVRAEDWLRYLEPTSELKSKLKLTFESFTPEEQEKLEKERLDIFKKTELTEFGYLVNYLSGIYALHSISKFKEDFSFLDTIDLKGLGFEIAKIKALMTLESIEHPQDILVIKAS